MILSRIAMKVKCLRTILFDLHCSLDLHTPTEIESKVVWVDNTQFLLW